MKNPIIMSPGPTMVRENVRFARAEETTNPDIDLAFYEFYKQTCNNIGELLKTNNEVRVLSGEGILGLESACASLTEKDDRVLVIENGVFGEGFGDFVKIYGGNPIYFRGSRTKKIDIDELRLFLEKDRNFKYATVVHCDTPSGVLNEIDKICPLLKEYGIITVVDSVAAMGGEELKVDEWCIDIVIGGSQKCLSAPPGLTVISISKDAFYVMESRTTPIASFYCNLLVWKNYYKDKWFPYTPPSSDIAGIARAVDNILEEKDIIQRHNKIAKATRKAIVSAGLRLHTENGYSNTVTVFDMPYSIDDAKVRKYMVENFNVMISGSFDYLSGKVMRIGHMGENARVDKVGYTLFALQKSLEHYGFKCNNDISKTFFKEI